MTDNENTSIPFEEFNLNPCLDVKTDEQKNDELTTFDLPTVEGDPLSDVLTYIDGDGYVRKSYI